MPIPLKPCEGKLSEQSQEALRRNRNREQWAQHQCETCGRSVGVEIVMGKWQPERHWPSVAYRARKSAPLPRQEVPWQSPSETGFVVPVE